MGNWLPLKDLSNAVCMIPSTDHRNIIQYNNGAPKDILQTDSMTAPSNDNDTRRQENNLDVGKSLTLDTTRFKRRITCCCSKPKRYDLTDLMHRWSKSTVSFFNRHYHSKLVFNQTQT